MRRRIALITGVYNMQGIGRQLCRRLAIDGLDICFSYWSPYHQNTNADNPSRIEQEIKKLGSECVFGESDLREEHSAAELVANCESTLGIPSVLINNAALGHPTDIESLSVKALDDHYFVNMRAPALMIQEFLKRQSNISSGRIINITSGQDLGPMDGEIAYAMTKAGMDMLTKQLYPSLATRGITINSINPGPADTGWMNEKIKSQISAAMPQGRINKAGDITNLVSFLVSAEGRSITGQVIHAEGGFNRFHRHES